LYCFHVVMVSSYSYYWTPRDVGRQLLFDPNPEDTLRVVIHVLANLELFVKQAWTKNSASATSVPPALLPVLEKVWLFDI
jgi:hypothetical protein